MIVVIRDSFENCFLNRMSQCRFLIARSSRLQQNKFGGPSFQKSLSVHFYVSCRSFLPSVFLQEYGHIVKRHVNISLALEYCSLSELKATADLDI